MQNYKRKRIKINSDKHQKCRHNVYRMIEPETIDANKCVLYLMKFKSLVLPGVDKKLEII